jgi:MFS transporter, DHA2 family, multidrug resistance protein
MSSRVTLAGKARSASRPVINPSIITIAVTIATVIEFVITSIANVSRPHIAGGFGCSLDEVTWIVTTYLVVNSVVQPMTRGSPVPSLPQAFL